MGLPKVSDERKALIVADYQTGMSMMDLLAKYGHSTGTFHKILKEAKVARTITEGLLLYNIKLNGGKDAVRQHIEHTEAGADAGGSVCCTPGEVGGHRGEG